MKQNRFYNSGFTLIEVMVAVSIFTIIMTVGIVALLTINNTYRKSQTDRQAIDAMTYTLESMSRRIRTSREWPVGINYGNPDTHFSFVDQDGILVTYNWIGSKIVVDIDNQLATNTVVVNGQYDITPDNVEITKLTFLPFESPAGFPYVQINVQGKVTNAKQVSDFSFQTGISKRTGVQ